MKRWELRGAIKGNDSYILIYAETFDKAEEFAETVFNICFDEGLCFITEHFGGS